MRRLTVLVSVLACLAAAPAAFAHNGPHAPTEGMMATWHGDTFGPGVVFGQGIDTGTSSLIPVEMDSVEAGRLAGKRVSVRGEKRGDTLVPAAGGVQKTGGSVAAAATGTKRIAVLLVNFTNNTAQPWTTCRCPRRRLRQRGFCRRVLPGRFGRSAHAQRRCLRLAHDS